MRAARLRPSHLRRSSQDRLAPLTEQAYKPDQDDSTPDHTANYFPGAQPVLSRRAKVFEPLAPTPYFQTLPMTKDAPYVRRDPRL